MPPKKVDSTGIGLEFTLNYSNRSQNNAYAFKLLQYGHYVTPQYTKSWPLMEGYGVQVLLIIPSRGIAGLKKILAMSERVIKKGNEFKIFKRLSNGESHTLTLSPMFGLERVSSYHWQRHLEIVGGPSIGIGLDSGRLEGLPEPGLVQCTSVPIYHLLGL